MKFALEMNKIHRHQNDIKLILEFFEKHKIEPVIYDEGSIHAALLRIDSEQALDDRPHEGRHLVVVLKDDPKGGRPIPVWACFAPGEEELEKALKLYRTYKAIGHPD
ncbi:MAG: hypothetical protein WC783_04670 [Candidatus Paceibacterota bacterium]|jgi:hypothetical protein